MSEAYNMPRVPVSRTNHSELIISS